MTLVNVTTEQQNTTARRLLKNKRHLWMRVGQYTIVLHGYGGEENPYWCVEITLKDDKPNTYHIVSEQSDSWHTGWFMFVNVGDAVNNALSAIVRIERERNEAGTATKRTSAD